MSKKLGVIGGMGPEATNFFYARLIARTKARCDQEHIDTIILSHATMPDRTQAILTGEKDKLISAITEDARNLERLGVSNIAIPCNTSHYFYDDIQAATKVPVIHMVEESIRYVKEKWPDTKKIGIMGTDGTIRAGTYHRACERYGITAVTPGMERQKDVMSLIYDDIKCVAMLRTIPGMTVIRPAESNEVAQAWAVAMQAKSPVILCLTRQTVPNLPKEVVEGRMDVAKGAYVVSCEEGFEVILIATGSEVSATLAAAEQLRAQGRKVRVVSMPSWELFERQDAAYREKVLPASCTRRVAVEAGSTFGWNRYVGDAGLVIGIDHFGASAPAEKLAEEYGFTPDRIAKAVADYLA